MGRNVDDIHSRMIKHVYVHVLVQYQPEEKRFTGTNNDID